METQLEYILTHSHKSEMIKYVFKNPESINELINLSLIDKQPYSWRAAWLLWSCVEPNDKRLKQYAPKFINAVKDKKDGQQRELLKILQLINIPEKLEGKLYDLCIGIWINASNSPSLRYNAFKILTTIAERYPDLKSELKAYTDPFYLDSLSHGARHSINKIINQKLK